MLNINLLPWRDDAKARQKKLFKMIALLSMMTLFLIAMWIYHHFKVELDTIEARMTRLTMQTEKDVNTPDQTLVALHNMVNKTRHNQDQLKKLLHAMFVYSTISWDSMEIQKGVVKVYGVANLTTLLLSFVDYCEKQFHFTVAIKSIKIVAPFDAIKFQVQVDRET